MTRLTMLAAAAFILVGTIGCQHNRCNHCEPAGGGLLSRLGGHLHHRDSCSVATGCRACKLGWQHGGLDYSEGLATGNAMNSHPGRQTPVPFRAAAGAAGLHGAGHHGAPPQYGPAGPPTAGVAYPYYTIRGPRDFLQDNPPSIGR